MPAPVKQPFQPFPWHYRGRAGVAAEPQKPWTERKLALLRHVEAKGGSFQVNRTWCMNTTANNQPARDLRRLIQEGLLDASTKAYTGRRSGYRQLILTEKGRAAIPVPLIRRVAQPYAKRNADFALMAQA